jgi:hypothetical protein
LHNVVKGYAKENSKLRRELGKTIKHTTLLLLLLRIDLLTTRKQNGSVPSCSTDASHTRYTATNLQLQIEQAAGAAKVDASGQAGDLLIVGSVDIGLDVVRALNLMSEYARWRV